MLGYSTLVTEYRSYTAYYTVSDSRGSIVIYTTNYKLADLYFRLCVKGHTTRTLDILARKGQWPRC